MEKGVICQLIKNKGYGYILDETGHKVFFHANDLPYNDFDLISVNDTVDFTAALTPKGFSVMKIEPTKKKKTTPGINPATHLEHFSDQERIIINNLKKVFYVTNGGGRLKLSESSYNFCLLKPTTFFEEQFNLNREITVVFSDFDTFEPRSLDPAEKIYTMYPNLRIDKICHILISKDPKIEERLKDLLRSNTEMQVVIPFSYYELTKQERDVEKYDLILNRFRKYFYDRDLFNFLSPLQKDIYFFGRRDYVHELVQRHFSRENSGVFGLRRSGKTSVLNAVGRVLERIDGKWIWLDGQTVSLLPWNLALKYIIDEICTKYGVSLITTDELYSSLKAAISFERDILSCCEQLNNKPILILFDEIEHITFDVALSQNWKSGEDFIRFWHTVRALFNKHPEKISFIIAGTNPKAVETPFINGYPNPLYNQLSSNKYLFPFSVSDTKDMVNKLGAYMGIKFDDYVCSTMTQDFGGHPFLIRQFCSKLSIYLNEMNFRRPFIVTKAIYDTLKPIFEESQADEYCEMILDVLKRNYPEELAMLESIALNNVEVLKQQEGNKSIISHLIGYGLIEKVETIYSFRIDIVKSYLMRKNKYQKILLTDEEKWAEINERRNRVEPMMRKIVQNQLKSFLGEKNARQKMLETIKLENRAKYSALSYQELFDPKKCEIYFSQLFIAISRNKSCFENIFTESIHTVSAYLTIINNLRKDCHASDVSNEEMGSFRGAISFIENEINKYFGM